MFYKDGAFKYKMEKNKEGYWKIKDATTGLKIFKFDVIKHISHTELTSTSKFKDGLRWIEDGEAFKMVKIKNAEVFAKINRVFFTECNC